MQPLECGGARTDLSSEHGGARAGDHSSVRQWNGQCRKLFDLGAVGDERQQGVVERPPPRRLALDIRQHLGQLRQTDPLHTERSQSSRVPRTGQRRVDEVAEYLHQQREKFRSGSGQQ